MKQRPIDANKLKKIYMAKGKDKLKLSTVINELEMMPSIDPVKHGEWEQCFEDWRCQIEGDKCSVCGFEHYGTNIRNYNYCPNCGARMDGE